MAIAFSQDLLNEMTRWMVVVARFGGALAFMPGLAVRHVPVVVKSVVAFGAALAGISHVPYISADHLVFFFVVLFREFLIGMLIGFMFASFVWFAEWVAELIDWQAGFGFSAIVDPIMGSRVAITARVATLLAGSLFFQLGGHHWLIRTIVESYRWLPVNADWHLRQQLGEAWLQFLAKGLFIVFPFGLPVMGIVLLIDIVLGAMGRAAPSLSVLLWGMPVRIFVVLFVITASLVGLPAILEQLSKHIVNTIPSLLQMMR